MQCADFIHFWLSITVDRVQNVYGLGACMEFEWPLSGLGRCIYVLFKSYIYELLIRDMKMMFVDLVNM